MASPPAFCPLNARNTRFGSLPAGSTARTRPLAFHHGGQREVDPGAVPWIMATECNFTEAHGHSAKQRVTINELQCCIIYLNMILHIIFVDDC